MDRVNFTVNGEKYSIGVADVSVSTSLNDFLRQRADLRGTKAMCHEGGCGACVVSVALASRGTFSVNSCLVAALSCHGWEITTVEGIGSEHAGYHPIQTRVATFNGTQCGFCTPGWVMNMYSLYEANFEKLTMKEIENSFGSNMCRCTGYRPILDAFKSLATDVDPVLSNRIPDLEDLAKTICPRTKSNCAGRCDDLDDWCVINKQGNSKIALTLSDNNKWYKVYKVKEVFAILDEEGYNSYRFVSGNTGQGVYHIENYPRINIDISCVEELASYQLSENMELGAGMTLTDLMETFRKEAETRADFKYLDVFHKHLDLVAHLPVRNVGTVGGNLALKNQHNEFPSDLFLLFNTVGAFVTLADNKDKRRRVSMEDFLNADLKGQIIINVLIPPLSATHLIRTYKIMPRAQNAHAMVNSGFRFKIDANNTIEKATIAYGNINPKFTRATKTEAAMIGKNLFSNETLKMALSSLETEIVPNENPPEPGAKFRKTLALNLFYKGILSLSPASYVDKKYKSGGEIFDRPVSKGSQIFDTDKSLWPLNQPIPKLEAALQTGGAKYSNDLTTQPREVHAAFVLATVPSGKIESFDATLALKSPGVIAFYTSKDIPGKNTFNPPSVPVQEYQEEILCSGSVLFYGQAVGIIVAESEKLANKAANLVVVKYKTTDKKPVLTIRNAIKAPKSENRIRQDYVIEAKDRGTEVTKVLKGTFEMKSQYHYTMETQTCVVVPDEGALDVYPASQAMDHAHVAIAQCLNVPENSINIKIRRIGGAYGGKASRASQVATACALVASKLWRPTRMVMSIETNMRMVGKRQDCVCDYEVGVNDSGVVQYLEAACYSDCGISYNDTATSVIASTLPSLYESSRWHVTISSVHTDKPTNTWCRAPGSTEATAIVEQIMERIALAVNKDPVDVRIANVASQNNAIKDMIETFKTQCDFENRQNAVDTFNSENCWKKRAIKLVIISFPVEYSGNYGVTISVYHADATVAISHAGVEMGQGINTKVAQVCAHTLGISLDKISVKSTDNFVSPNAMATNGSFTSESVCFATLKACAILTERLSVVKDELENPTWETLITTAYNRGYNLQSSYMMSELDKLEKYSVYGVTVSEVELDVLTGRHQVLRVDILEDTGQSLSPEVDVGQIEGAFMMGLGLWTSEHLIYAEDTGRLLTDRTWTYKPPGAKDIPIDMRVYFRRNSPNPVGVLRSKATGEPALLTAISVPLALQAAAMLARQQFGYTDTDLLHIDTPYTAENILNAISPKLENYKLKP